MNSHKSLTSTRLKSVLTGFLFVLLGPLPLAQADSVSLAWNGSAGASGYRIYYGTSVGSMSKVSDVGNSLQATISSLTAGQQYFFEATAYNAAGVESDPSNQVSATLSAAPTPTPTPTPKPTPSPPGSSKIISSLFTSTDVPGEITANDSNSVELGVKFQSSTSGQVTAIRFYKGPQNTGLHTGNLWNSSGALLATVTFTNESSSGWQQANLTIPVTLTAGSTYVVSYHTEGYYSDDQGYFSNPHTSGPLTASTDSNGVYAYSNVTVFPTNTYNSTNYWVDVVFASISQATATPTPTPSSSLFTSTDTPGTVTVNDSNSLELGVKFQTSTARQVIAFRFYKGPQNTGYHVGNLWTTSGTLLASATFTNETSSGWQQVTLANPVTLTPGQTYIVSYFSNGYYSATDNYFTNEHNSDSLTALSDSESGGNGVYSYGGSSLFPSNSYYATNYWVDIVLK